MGYKWEWSEYDECFEYDMEGECYLIEYAQSEQDCIESAQNEQAVLPVLPVCVLDY